MSFSALIERVSTLGVSRRERFVSRICFYLLVGFVMWGANRLAPDFAALEAQQWEALGVARPYIAVPVAEMDMVIVREIR